MSPSPPNSSVGTIKADQSRIFFDTEVTKKSYKFAKFKLAQLEENTLQSNL